MTAILAALGALFVAASKNDWTTAVAQTVVLVQAVIAAFPAHVQPVVHEALLKGVRVPSVHPSVGFNPDDEGSFNE